MSRRSLFAVEYRPCDVQPDDSSGNSLPSHRQLTTSVPLTLLNTAMASLIIPLSPIDNYLHTVGWTIGFQLDSTTFDPRLLDEAAARVVRKWRLLAARVEWDKQASPISLAFT